METLFANLRPKDPRLCGPDGSRLAWAHQIAQEHTADMAFIHQQAGAHASMKVNCRLDYERRLGL